jgi:hypothetical protein
MCGGDCGGTSGGAGCQNPLVDIAKRLQRGEDTASTQLQAEQSASGQNTRGGAAGSRPTTAKAKRSSHKARYQAAPAAAPAGTAAPYLGYFDGRHRFIGSQDNTNASSSSALINTSCHGCNNQIKDHVDKGMGKHLYNIRRVKTHRISHCFLLCILAAIAIATKECRQVLFRHCPAEMPH